MAKIEESTETNFSTETPVTEAAVAAPRPVLSVPGADLPDRTRWFPRLAAEEISQLLDESTLLVLPSRSEGLGRVVVESMSRGRPVIATRVGGPAELVDNGRTGFLVAPGDTHALADALVRVLTDRELAARLGGAARAGADARRVTPGEFASRLRAFVERVGS